MNGNGEPKGSRLDMEVEYGPHLVESVVRRHVDRDTDGVSQTFHALFDELVDLRLDGEPERVSNLHSYLFFKLGLDGPVRDVAAEYPEAPRRIRVGPADGLEGCFLSPARDVVIVRLFAERFDEAALLRRYLRNEWMHIADMIDPAFEFPGASEDLDPPTRDRYALLWGAYADARIARSGRSPLRDREAWEQEVDRFWSDVAPELRRKAFDGFWSAAAFKHEDLMDMVRNPRRFITRFTGAPERAIPGGRCPLCGFPTFDWVLPGTRLTEEMAKRIAGEFPHWYCDEGACNRCVELYEVQLGRW